MSALGERDDDEFYDFSDQIFKDFGEPVKEKKSEINNEHSVLTQETEVHTSYILVNALLSLLIQKGIIKQSEVNQIVEELHAQYMRKKRG